MRTRVAIVGCGLIGGSAGLALARRDDYDVAAVFDRDAACAEAAVAAGAAGRAARDPADAAAGCDLVLVGVPVSSIAECAIAAAHAAPRAVVTDVGSVKAPVVAAVEAACDGPVRFCGGHPMAGSELAGFSAADPELFSNAVWVVTPTERTDADAAAAVHNLAAAVGASPVSLPPQVHDEIVAVVSHLPHVAATALMQVAVKRAEDAPILRLAAGGFRDVTRIAAGSPRVWEDILSENADAVRNVLDAYVDALTGVRADLDDRIALRATLEHASRARAALPIPEVAAELVSVAVAISDRPGAFAQVTNAIGEAGLNIVDLELRHSAEGGHGLLTLTMAADAAPRAASLLRGLGHSVHVEGGEIW